MTNGVWTGQGVTLATGSRKVGGDRCLRRCAQSRRQWPVRTAVTTDRDAGVGVQPREPVSCTKSSNEKTRCIKTYM